MPPPEFEPSNQEIPPSEPGEHHPNATPGSTGVPPAGSPMEAQQPELATRSAWDSRRVLAILLGHAAFVLSYITLMTLGWVSGAFMFLMVPFCSAFLIGKIISQ